VITVNGKAVNPGDGDSDGGGVQEVLRAARMRGRLSCCEYCASMTPLTRTPLPPPSWAMAT
jgi:hypothetical protein